MALDVEEIIEHLDIEIMTGIATLRRGGEDGNINVDAIEKCASAINHLISARDKLLHPGIVPDEDIPPVEGGIDFHWEYMIDTIHITMPDRFQDHDSPPIMAMYLEALNTMGAEGWELVQSKSRGPCLDVEEDRHEVIYSVIMKRRKDFNPSEIVDNKARHLEL